MNVIELPKQILRWSGFKQRHNHAGHLIGVADLLDAQGVTLPGYTLQIEIKAPVDASRCLFLFSIMRLHQKQRYRVYQLEVAPHNKRTHNGENPIYGPHEHIGELEPIPVNHQSVNCENWNGALDWFFNRIFLQPFDVESPQYHVAYL